MLLGAFSGHCGTSLKFVTSSSTDVITDITDIIELGRVLNSCEIPALIREHSPGKNGGRLKLSLTVIGSAPQLDEYLRNI